VAEEMAVGLMADGLPALRFAARREAAHMRPVKGRRDEGVHQIEMRVAKECSAFCRPQLGRRGGLPLAGSGGFERPVEGFDSSSRPEKPWRFARGQAAHGRFSSWRK